MDEQSELQSAGRFLAELTFQKYIFNKIEFIYNELYDGEKVQVNFKIGHRIALDTEKNQATVTLTCTVFPEPKINHYPFTVNAEITGIFGYNPGMPEDKRDGLLGVNALAILFPYVRSAISSVTASAGVAPLVLQPINIVEYLNPQQSSQSSST